MARVKLERLRKVYGDNVVAVHGATFEVQDGEFVVLVGPSGCGKSTTLRMIAGLETITTGRLHIGDRLVNDMPPKERDIAMVFQNYALYPHMTAYENMAFGLKIRKYPSTEIDQRVREAAATLSIEHVLDRKPKALSGGQRQRVAVGRAIVRDPEVFLFDEPLSNLDAKLRVQMRTEIARLHTQLGATMIYVTHDQTEAMTMGDRIVVLRDGHIQQIDTPLRLYNRPINRFVASFIGSPSMNLVEGRLIREEDLLFQARNDAFTLPIGPSWAAHLGSYASGSAITMGIRPEDLYLAKRSHAEGPVAQAPFQLAVVEPMGNEIIVYARATAGHQDAEADPIVGRITPQELPETGGTVELAFDLQKLHFFDAETGASLHPERAAATAP